MRARFLLPAAVAIAGLAGLAAHVTYSAFWSRSQNPNASYAAGTVYVTDNDAGARMLSLTSAIPGNSDTSCISVTYSGTLPAAIKLHGTVTGSIGPYVNLVITRGTSTSGFDNCSGFAADTTNYLGLGAGVVYSGTLSALPSTYDSGLADPPSGTAETWTTGEVHVYKFVATLADANAAQGQSGSATFTWEARNL